MMITRKKLMKYGMDDHREKARLAFCKLRIGESYYWRDCQKVASAAQAGQMVKRWGLIRTFCHATHMDGGFIITRVA